MRERFASVRTAGIGKVTALRWPVVACSAVLLGACHASPSLNPAPEVSPAGALQAALPEPMIDDSAADEAALSALRALEFQSLAKGGGHVRGSMTALSEIELEGLIRLPEHPRGGASATGSKYDIDVESFVSHRRVQYYIDFFEGPSRDRFAVWLSRLSRYEGMIQDHLRRYGLPQDLLFLALIESGYSNTAVSRASAVGMWQFIASTGRRYGLRIDAWVDERRDPYKATDAAVRHLADLKDQFGAWYLAAAAYNAGPTRVSRGLRRLRGRQSLSDTTFFALYDRRYLRRETRDYVPKLIAATLVAKDPARFGFTDLSGLPPLVFDEITVPDQTGLDVLAELADTTARALVELNPGFYRGATPPHERATVRVPRGKGNQVVRRYAALPASDRVNFLVHRIRRGETLGVIAKRYGVALRHIYTANPGIRPRKLRIGQRVTIPISSAARQGALAPSRSSRVRTRAAPSSGTVTVRRGDSLWLVSQRYGVSIHNLRRWNGIPESVSLLSVGQKLRVTPPPSR